MLNYFSGRQERQNNADQMGREQPRVLRVQSRRQARRTMSDTRLHQGLYNFDTGMLVYILQLKFHVNLIIMFLILEELPYASLKVSI